MRFSSAVIISLLLYNSFVFSNGSFLMERELRTRGQSLTEEFFDEMKVEMQETNPRQITVVGASEDQLELTKPLLKAFPHFVGKSAYELCASSEHGPECTVIYFLVSLEKEYLTKVMNDLRKCNRHNVYFAFGGSFDDSIIGWMLLLTAMKVTLEGFFLWYSEKSVEVYSFDIQRDCVFRLKLKRNWTSTSTWKKVELRHSVSTGLYGCTLPVGTINHKRWMNLGENEDGTVKIIGGFEGNLITTISQEMDFTPLVKRLDVPNQHINNTSKAIVASCSARNTILGIGNIRPTETGAAEVGITKSYRQQCIVWCVPRIIQSKDGIIISEFSWSTWIFVGLMFLAMLGVEKIVRNMDRPDRGNVKEPECFGIILDVIGITLGNTVVYNPLFVGSKVLLIIYLTYSIVITTAYKSSLASILTLGSGESLIVDLEGIIKANLTTGGNEFTLDVLQDQKDEHKFIPELLKRFVVERNISKALQQVSQDKNLAYLISRPDLDYYKKLSENAGEPLSFDVLNGCVLIHGTVIVVPNDTIHQVRIDKVIQKMVESGILEYWEQNDTNWNQVNTGRAQNSEMTNTREELNKFTLDKFNSIFILYCLSLTFCTLIFLGELIFHEFESLGRVERSKILKRLKFRRRIPI